MGRLLIRISNFNCSRTFKLECKKSDVKSLNKFNCSCFVILYGEKTLLDYLK